MPNIKPTDLNVPSHPQTDAASEHAIAGSNGRHNIRPESVACEMPPAKDGPDGKPIQDRAVARTVPGDKPADNGGLSAKNIQGTLKLLQNTINKLARPKFRPSKNDALIQSVKKLRHITGKLGSSGSDLLLKRTLTDLLATTVLGSPQRMSLADAGNTAKQVRIVLDAPARDLMEQKVADLLHDAQDALKHYDSTRRQDKGTEAGVISDLQTVSEVAPLEDDAPGSSGAPVDASPLAAQAEEGPAAAVGKSDTMAEVFPDAGEPSVDHVSSVPAPPPLPPLPQERKTIAEQIAENKENRAESIPQPDWRSEAHPQVLKRRAAIEGRDSEQEDNNQKPEV